MNSFFQDLNYAFRNLKSKPGFTFIALLILTLGIGANTALFSILYSVLWKAYPYPEADRLTIVWESGRKNPTRQNTVNPGNFAYWREHNQVFTDMAAFFSSAANLTSEGPPEEVPIQNVTSNFFQVMGLNAFRGRTFVPADESTGDRLVMLGHAIWMRRFGGDPGIIGKQIYLNGKACTVVGIAPPGFRWYVKHGWITSKPPQLWVLMRISPEMRQAMGRYLSVVARMKPGVTVAQANANMKVVARQLETQFYQKNAGWTTLVVPIREQFAGELRKPLWILAGAVGFVLLISCSNLANLLLVRSLTRRKETAIRAALGAGRVRIIRQLLTESVLLSALGGAGATLLAYWAVEALTRLGYRAGIDFGNVEMNWVMLSFSFALSLITGLVFGIAPAFAASKIDLTTSLKQATRGTTGQTGAIRAMLVVVEIAVTVVLLTGAGLMIQTFWRLSSVDPGFNANQVLSFRILLPSVKYSDDPRIVTFFRNLMDQLQTAPGVKSAGMVNFLPFAGPASDTSFYIVGRPKPLPGQQPSTEVLVADDGYFKTLQIALKHGRYFSRSETTRQSNRILINEAFAKKYFAEEDPIGKKLVVFMSDTEVEREIIGIVGDVRFKSVQDVALPTVYYPYADLPFPFMNILVRTDGDPRSFSSSAAAIVRRLDPDLPLADMRLMKEWVGDSTARARFSMVLLATLAALALILATAGIYGVLSHLVLQRTQELGIRMAFGASGLDLFKLVLKQSLKMIAAGILVGVAVSLTLTRLMQSMLFQTEPSDPAVFATVIGFLLLTALLACTVPSRRAAKVDPLVALRYE